MNQDTSWENVNGWYNKLLAVKGDYYHKNVVIPKTLQLLDIRNNSSLLDVACGQGILERVIPQGTIYLGIDKSKGLVEEAKKLNKNPLHKFEVGDVTKTFKSERKYTHATLILALQNIDKPKELFENVYHNLEKGGKFIIVLNHPSFRIPRHSTWEDDVQNNTIYRKTNKYMSILKIPVVVNPSLKDKSPVTTNFHYPLGYISEQLFKTGFVIEKIEEWVSDKESVGKHAKAENKARNEFPLFMAIRAVKI